MSGINDDLQNTIEKHLPEMVGKQLQAALKRGEEDRDKLDTLEEKYLEMKAKYDVLERQHQKFEANESKEKELDAKAQSLDLKEQILKIREDHAKERVSEIRGLTERVFGSNRMGYNLNLQVPNANYGKRDQYGNNDCMMTIPAGGRIEKDDTNG